MITDNIKHDGEGIIIYIIKWTVQEKPEEKILSWAEKAKARVQGEVAKTMTTTEEFFPEIGNQITKEAVINQKFIIRFFIELFYHLLYDQYLKKSFNENNYFFYKRLIIFKEFYSKFYLSPQILITSRLSYKFIKYIIISKFIINK